MFVIYLLILKIRVNNLQSLQISVYFLKMKPKVCKILKNKLCK